MTAERSDELKELLAEVRRIQVQSDRLVAGVMAGSYSSVFRGAGVEFDEVREYEEGDDPRSVDWNVTARVGRPFVRKYVDERELSVAFLIDLSASMDGGFGGRSARHTAARVCACLGLSAARNNDRVGMVAFADRVEKYVPARKGVDHALRIVRDCLVLRAARPDAGGDLRSALSFTTRVLPRHSVVFVLSDFLSDGWHDALALCNLRHDVIAVRLLLPELELEPSGLLRVVDPENGRSALVDTRSARVRKAYAGRVAQWRARTEQALTQARVDRMDVPVLRDSSRSVARPILQFFGMRERRSLKR